MPSRKYRKKINSDLDKIFMSQPEGKSLQENTEKKQLYVDKIYMSQPEGKCLQENTEKNKF